MLVLATALAATALLVAGCGGGGNSSSGDGLPLAVGGVTFRVDWPARTKNVPLVAESLEFVIGDGTVTPSKVLNRPAEGGTSTISFDSLTPGQVTYTVNAYAQADKGGMVVGTAAGVSTVTSGQATPVTLSSVMSSTIDTVKILAAGAPSVPVGGIMQLVANAKDAEGNVILISTSNLLWTSSAPTYATVSSSGKVSAVKVGTTDITVTEKESGKTDMMTVTVTDGTTAHYVGRATCKVCHGTIDAEYSTQNHGFNFRVVHGDQITGNGGRCASCHTTGFGDVEHGGYNTDGSTPYLEGIGCESCHGPGSNHASGPSKTNISRVPNAEKTCWSCHVDSSYKSLDLPITPVTDATLATKAPNSVLPHHPQATFMQGRLGFGYTMDRPGVHGVLVNNTCVTCHLQPKRSNNGTGKVDHSVETLKVDFEACAQCHGGGTTAKLATFEEEITGKMIELGGEDPANPGHPDEMCTTSGMLFDYAKAHGIDVATNTNPDDPYVKAYKAAAWNYRFVYLDLSGGVHNPSFARRLLDDAKQKLLDTP